MERDLFDFEYEETLDEYGVSENFDDYNELALQYGYLTLFAVAFPLVRRTQDRLMVVVMKGPCDELCFPSIKLGNRNDCVCLCYQVASLALLNNLLELRADSGRLCRLYRRPIPYGASDIGTWYAIFQVISFMAVTTNCGKAQQLDLARSRKRD